MSTSRTLGLEPHPGEGGAWRGRTAGGTAVLCGGDERGPDPARAATLADLAERLDAVLDEIRRWAAGLPPDGLVPFEGRPREGFRLGSCGLDGPMTVLLIEARGPGAASVAVLLVHTGLPDGHVDFRVTVDEGRPVAVTAWV